ncbi:Eukaryotic translation initiation factor 5 [Wickerhamiella sorbophila]|uniref:Eukaryotic translation initiation factor 5 n=1 Tax=Wickerhamiella sorbophila TaxID=45607 RepID=A0A2T0FM65_9ASCO|nr:Eukaryotic translation initiation factor 5 [Wickerhamiella sorbophila]PRT56069.1 Eukaryotic translation initiation factor 5 [Wickerhamiella sorbophila]
MSINIRRDNKDPFYRYKMPPIQAKIEGRGNGIKTAVLNTSDVARALSRPPSYIIKYFGFELGAQTSISESTERYLVNGVHDAAKLQDSLDGFIAKFVLCGSCKNPETEFVVLKDGNLEKDCKACGAKTLADPRHRLTSFIVKNPPETAKSKKKAMANAGASTSTAEANAAADAADGGDDGEDDGGDDELTRRINAEAANLPEMDGSDDDDDQWTADVSEEAVRARQKQLERTMANLGVDDDGTDQAVYHEFGEWIESNEDCSDIDIYKKALDLGIQKNPKTVQVLAQALFSEDIVKEIPEHVGLLSKMVTSPKHEKALLGGLERFIGLQHPDLIKEVPNVLFKLYDADLISEDVIVAWGTKASKRFVDKDTSKKVRRAAKPFMDWLDEAESESESESGDE